MDQQQPQQQGTQRVVGRPFTGSGNPSGVTRTQQLFEAFRGEFVRVHAREPSAIEAASLRSVASLSARIAGNKLDAEGLTRATNAMTRSMRLLGLKPSRPARPVRSAPSLDEIVRRRSTG
jgi:hypothetical protein